MNLDDLLSIFPEPVGPLKILIVDDQPVNIRALHGIFRADFEVFMATNGEQAITICRQQRPDIILLDVVMPGISGHEVCRRLKADPATRETPIIFVTSQSEDDDEALGFELGAVDFITKPINPVTVQARVRTHVALKLQTDLLRSFAMMDGLTRIPNRRKFDEAFKLSWRGCVREQQPLSLALIDVDFFKQYNDRYGHQVGDTCLIAVAESLSGTLRRPYDLVARYGGEEFACLLPNTDRSGAQSRGEVMREAVKALEMEHQGSQIGPHLTVSIGIATHIPGPDDVPELLLRQADEQLYKAKQNGRDRVCSIDVVNA